MNKLILIIFPILLFISFSCNTITEPTEKENNWEKIEIAGEGSVYSFYGSFEDYLLIGTSGKILRSDNFGKSWAEVYKPLSTIINFNKRNDTLFAVSNYDDYYSLDEGESWSLLNYDFSIGVRSDSVVSSHGKIYKMQSLSYGELGHPTLILRSTDNGKTWEKIFPFKHYVYSIYIDNKDRLYLGINGAKWNEEKQGFEHDSENKAIIYYLNTL